MFTDYKLSTVIRTVNAVDIVARVFEGEYQDVPIAETTGEKLVREKLAAEKGLEAAPTPDPINRYVRTKHLRDLTLQFPVGTTDKQLAEHLNKLLGEDTKRTPIQEQVNAIGEK